MAKHDHCVVKAIRKEVANRLGIPVEVPQRHYREETPDHFWERVEQAGLLDSALAHYDRVLAERRAWSRVPRETKEAFMRRLDQEGRLVEGERIRAELMASGLSQRECQMELVQRLQPLDGTRTRAWETPDAWQHGRLFRSKEEQKRLNSLSQKYHGAQRDQTEAEAERRVSGASTRYFERKALAAARQRARALKRADIPVEPRPLAEV